MEESQLEKLNREFEDLMNEMIHQQQAKVLKTARAHLPHLTGDDIMNPHDYPELMADPVFNYEEGMAAGLLAAQIAIRARVLRPRKAGDSSL
jgi:hypothetical protein